MRLLYTFLLLLFSTLSASAQNHTQLTGLSLGMEPAQLVGELERKGLHAEGRDDEGHRYRLSGRVSGVEMLIDVNCNADMTAINHVRFVTRTPSNQQEAYSRLLTWLKKHHGAPHWSGRVRGNSFSRWFVEPDRDIVIIEAGAGDVEIYFYENHVVRNIDYYSILKHCEKNPVPGIPHLTANEAATWERRTIPVATPKRTTVKRKGRRTTVRRGKTNRRRR